MLYIINWSTLKVSRFIRAFILNLVSLRTVFERKSHPVTTRGAKPFPDCANTTPYLRSSEARYWFIVLIRASVYITIRSIFFSRHTVTKTSGGRRFLIFVLICPTFQINRAEHISRLYLTTGSRSREFGKLNSNYPPSPRWSPIN